MSLGKQLPTFRRIAASRDLIIPLLLDCFPLKKALRYFEMTVITFPHICYNILEDLNLHHYRYESQTWQSIVYFSEAYESIIV